MTTLEKALKIWKENKGKDGYLKLTSPKGSWDHIAVWDDSTEDEVMQDVAKKLTENPNFDNVIFESE